MTFENICTHFFMYLHHPWQLAFQGLSSFFLFGKHKCVELWSVVSKFDFSRYSHSGCLCEDSEIENIKIEENLVKWLDLFHKKLYFQTQKNVKINFEKLNQFWKTKSILKNKIEKHFNWRKSCQLTWFISYKVVIWELLVDFLY